MKTIHREVTYSKDGVRIIRQTLRDVSRFFLTHCGLKPGDHVVVVRKAETEAEKLGWGIPWNETMTKSVGHTLKVLNVSLVSVQLAFDGRFGFFYPAHVLRKVK